MNIYMCVCVYIIFWFIFQSLLISPAHEALSYYERQSQEYENDQRNRETAQSISW